MSSPMATFRHKRTGKVVEVPDDEARRYRNSRWIPISTEPQAVQIQVPEGTVAEVLAWVGDDLDRRRAALEAEREGKRRKTLLMALT